MTNPTLALIACPPGHAPAIVILRCPDGSFVLHKAPEIDMGSARTLLEAMSDELWLDANLADMKAGR